MYSITNTVMGQLKYLAVLETIKQVSLFPNTGYTYIKATVIKWLL